MPFPPTAERFERLEETLQICNVMWAGDTSGFRGKHYVLEETICQPMPVSSPKPRIMIGGGGERKTLRLVAQYADACNIMGSNDELAHKIDVLRRHCDDVGRDVNDIEITTMYREPNPSVDDILAAAESLAGIGVRTIVGSPIGDDPAGNLEATWAPAMDQLKQVEAKRF